MAKKAIAIVICTAIICAIITYSSKGLLGTSHLKRTPDFDAQMKMVIPEEGINFTERDENGNPILIEPATEQTTQ